MTNSLPTHTIRDLLADAESIELGYWPAAAGRSEAERRERWHKIASVLRELLDRREQEEAFIKSNSEPPSNGAEP